MNRCPNCRARYRKEDQCHRCGMELADLSIIETQAVELLHLAVHKLAEGQRLEAVLALHQSLALQKLPLALALLAFLQTKYAGRLLPSQDCPTWPVGTTTSRSG